MKRSYTKKQIMESISYWKKMLESMKADDAKNTDTVDETEQIDEARGKGIGDAFQTIYKTVAVQLQAAEKAEMESWKALIKQHQDKMADIKRRRAEALAQFRTAQSNLNRAGIDIDATDDLGEIAAAAGDFTTGS